jgi:hypothetical protein
MKNRIRMLWVIIGLVIIAGPRMTHAYEVGEVEKGGTIQGHVTFSGSPPGPVQFKVDKNPEVCGQERSLMKVDARNGFLTGAVVVLEGVEKGKPFFPQTLAGAAPGEGTFQHQGGESLGLQVHTKGCNFGPFTGVVAADQPIQFGNQDSIKHILHTFVAKGQKGSILRTIHNRDIQPDHEMHLTMSSGKLKDSRMIRFACNRHDFMENWLYVVKNPYFAITDEKGQFVIDNIPPGHYTLRAWHPLLGLQEQEVHVTPEKSLDTDFAFSG